MAEGGGFGFAEGAEFAGAALGDGAGEFVCKGGGFGAGALGKRENVKIGEGERLDESNGRGVVVFGFAGENGGVGEAVMDEFDAAGVMLRAVPAVHGGEDAVGGRLKGHVKVLGDAIGGSEEIDEVLGNVEGLDGATAEAFDGGFAENFAEEIFEFDPGGKIAAVGAEIDPAENDFAESRFGEALDFMNHGLRWKAAASPADEGDHAVGEAGIAAVLDFEGGAGVIPFPAEDGGGEEGALFENITG